MASRIQLQTTITGKETKHMSTAACAMLWTAREGTITNWVNNTSFQLCWCKFLTDLHIPQPRSDSFHMLQISQMQILIALHICWYIKITALSLMIKYKMYIDYTFKYISGLIKKLNLLTQSDSQVSAHNYLKQVLRNLSRFNINHLPYHSIGWSANSWQV